MHFDWLQTIVWIIIAYLCVLYGQRRERRRSDLKYKFICEIPNCTFKAESNDADQLAYASDKHTRYHAGLR